MYPGPDVSWGGGFAGRRATQAYPCLDASKIERGRWSRETVGIIFTYMHMKRNQKRCIFTCMFVLHAYVQGAMLKIMERPKSVMEVNESWM